MKLGQMLGEIGAIISKKVKEMDRKDWISVAKFAMELVDFISGLFLSDVLSLIVTLIKEILISIIDYYEKIGK